MFFKLFIYLRREKCVLFRVFVASLLPPESLRCGSRGGKKGGAGAERLTPPSCPRGCVWRDPATPLYSSGLPTLTSPRRFLFQASLPRTALAGGWLEWIWVPGSLRPAVWCPEVWEVWCVPRAGPCSPRGAAFCSCPRVRVGNGPREAPAPYQGIPSGHWC